MSIRKGFHSILHALLILFALPSAAEPMRALHSEPLSADTTAVVCGTNLESRINIHGGSGALAIVVPPDASIATASLDDRQLLLVGMGEGSTSITITDASSPPETITIEITVVRVTIDNWWGTPATLSGSVTNASLLIGVTNDGGVTQALSGRFTANDLLEVSVTIVPDPADVGLTGSLLAVAIYDERWYMRDGEGWRSWNGDPASLTAADGPRPLSASEHLDIATLNGLPGDFTAFAGYRIGDEVTYTAVPVTFTVE